MRTEVLEKEQFTYRTPPFTFDEGKDENDPEFKANIESILDMAERHIKNRYIVLDVAKSLGVEYSDDTHIATFEGRLLKGEIDDFYVFKATDTVGTPKPMLMFGKSVNTLDGRVACKEESQYVYGQVDPPAVNDNYFKNGNTVFYLEFLFGMPEYKFEVELSKESVDAGVQYVEKFVCTERNPESYRLFISRLTKTPIPTIPT